MAVSVRELAEWIQGEVVGDATILIQAARPLSDAQCGDLTFVDNEKHLQQYHQSPASVAITPLHLPLNGKTVVRVKDPLMAFVSVVQKLHGRPPITFSGVHPTAVVHSSVTLPEDIFIGPYVTIGEGVSFGKNCRIHAHVAIGNYCELKDDVTLHPHVVLYDGCVLGNRVIVHANAVLGADGFGYRIHQGKHVRIPQLGRVELADDVEIGACTTIDRATFGSTRIGEGTKIDNLVMVGHNCQIGKHNLLVSQVGIAGSVTTGDYVVMAGQVGIADHCHIGDRAQLGAKCGVHKDVPANARMLGAPATPDREQMRIMMSLERLPELRKQVRKIMQQLGMNEEQNHE